MPDVPSDRPARRPRYRGSHPRAFSEKYKELSPARYPDEIGKVLASGKTPAGMHRPIMVQEVIDALAPRAGDFAVDATLGYGGHTAALLDRVLPGGRVLALDVDPIELPKTEARLRAASLPPGALIVCRSNFAGLAGVLASHDLPPADVVLADLGLSSMQLDDPSRGFTFRRPGPLDLRMNPGRGQPASVMLAALDAPRLADILDANADQPDALSLAAALVERGRRAAIATTTDLSEAVEEALCGPGVSTDDINASIRRVFQALRIAVNDELGALDTFLRLLPQCVAPGGRVAILSFHSGEDRRVKQAFRDGVRSGAFASIADEIVRPSAAERRLNSRSSSAKLRWAIRR